MTLVSRYRGLGLYNVFEGAEYEVFDNRGSVLVRGKMNPDPPYDTPEVEISEAWFRAHGLGGVDPIHAAAEWWSWLDARSRSQEARLRKALELASGLSEAAIRHYRAGRAYKLGSRMLQELDALARLLGRTAPPRARREGVEAGRCRGQRQVALLTPLADLPSQSYHLEVIRGIVAGTSRHALATALHAVEPDELEPALAGLLRASRPDAVVLLRLTPDPGALDLLARRRVPAVLVHADRYRYPSPPVLAHVIPAQEPIARAIEDWARRIVEPPRRRQRSPRIEGGVVVVAMPRERPGGHLEPISGIDPSLRNRRIDLVLEGLRDFQPAVAFVADYSFRHAPAVLAAHPDASAFVCLGDELAVALKHLLAATGRDWRDRVLGFDDSRLAQAEQISSFGQQLERIGAVVADRIGERLRSASGDCTAPWPEFVEVATDVYLVSRG
jgi:DNA-binding LacI/PurR family transcriptional regulator